MPNFNILLRQGKIDKLEHDNTELQTEVERLRDKANGYDILAANMADKNEEIERLAGAMIRIRRAIEYYRQNTGTASSAVAIDNIWNWAVTALTPDQETPE